jgi:hypothetical protein
MPIYNQAQRPKRLGVNRCYTKNKLKLNLMKKIKVIMMLGLTLFVFSISTILFMIYLILN